MRVTVSAGWAVRHDTAVAIGAREARRYNARVRSGLNAWATIGFDSNCVFTIADIATTK